MPNPSGVDLFFFPQDTLSITFQRIIRPLIITYMWNLLDLWSLLEESPTTVPSHPPYVSSFAHKKFRQASQAATQRLYFWCAETGWRWLKSSIVLGLLKSPALRFMATTSLLSLDRSAKPLCFWTKQQLAETASMCSTLLQERRPKRSPDRANRCSVLSTAIQSEGAWLTQVGRLETHPSHQSLPSNSQPYSGLVHWSWFVRLGWLHKGNQAKLCNRYRFLARPSCTASSIVGHR